MNSWLKKNNLLVVNYRQKKVPALGGIILIPPFILGWYFLFELNLINLEIYEVLLFLTVVTVAIGLVDDLSSNSEIKGFTGHFQQLFVGEITTGILKVFLLTFLAMVTIYYSGISLLNFIIIINVLLIILTANLLNLLDLRPGRAIKSFFLSSFLLIILSNEFIFLLIPLLFVLPYLWFELKEKVMLGDSGANLLGVLLGYSFTFFGSLFFRLLLVLSLLVLNFLSEKISFNKVICRNSKLAWFDKLGRD